MLTVYHIDLIPAKVVSIKIYKHSKVYFYKLFYTNIKALRPISGLLIYKANVIFFVLILTNTTPLKESSFY
jgi:hypothetical protein